MTSGRIPSLMLFHYIIRILLLSIVYAASIPSTILRTGQGKADITGKIGEVGMMGYAYLPQYANGIHLRLYARAFIMGSEEKRIVYVSADLGQMSHFVRSSVVKRLNNPLYTEDNIMVSATHTHSGPAGYLEYFLYQVTTFGKIQDQRDVLVNGITKAILAAHDEFERNNGSYVSVGQSKVHGISRNRSPTSYVLNPESERNRYEDGNTDKTLTLLSFKDINSRQITGAVSWFAVHGTSMEETNYFVSGDNQGYASHLWEETQKAKGFGSFVGAFSQSNSGDVTPNTDQPVCQDTGLPCDGSVNTCPDKDGKRQTSMCIGRGAGGKNNFETVKIAGSAMMKAAYAISKKDDQDLLSVQGAVDYRHVWVDMSNISFSVNGTEQHTCEPALGQSFAAGTTDGPGIDIMYQGAGPLDFKAKILSSTVHFAAKRSGTTDALESCQSPKTVLLATGHMNTPYKWQPSVLALQMFTVGRKLAIIGFPGMFYVLIVAEITTMAGRRLREATLKQLIDDKTLDDDAQIVIAGLANTYASYVTTFEEYQNQRYEGGSTLFGPHTLAAFIDQYTKVAASFKDISKLPKSSTPVREGDYTELEMSNNILHPVLWDSTPMFSGTNFGDVILDVSPVANLGDVVFARFQCAHPRGQEPGKPFMTVEKKSLDGSWEVILDDGAWDTKYMWSRTRSLVSPTSECEISWSIHETTPVSAGTYRMKLYGTYKSGAENIPFSGVTREFEVRPF